VIDSDVLYLPEEQRELAAHLPNARLVTIESITATTLPDREGGAQPAAGRIPRRPGR